MPIAKKSETVPKAVQEKFDRIVAITDDFSRQYLNDEYAQLIRFATAALCRKRPSPLASGKENTWACGITHAIGMVNFLYDSSQKPHMSVKDLYQWFGVSSSTGASKSKQVRDALDTCQMDPNWSLSALLDKNPLAWMVSFNGLIVDARSLPRPFQVQAYARGLIPYIPGEDGKPNSENDASEEEIEVEVVEEEIIEKKTEKKTKASTQQKTAVPGSPDAVYELEVYIIDGPITDKFIAKNPVVCRTIEIQGRNTLEDLHYIIFKAFNREDEHMYEFQIGGKSPQDPKAKRYGVKQALSGSSGKVGDVAKTSIASLGLSIEDMFGYWFDFGDDWWHQIDVISIKDKAPKGKYPKITKRVGASPPQYVEW